MTSKFSDKYDFRRGVPEDVNVLLDIVISGFIKAEPHCKVRI